MTIEETEEWGIGGRDIDAEKVKTHAEHNVESADKAA